MEVESGLESQTRAVREVGPGLLLPDDDEAVWAMLRELYRLDIANLTPVRALVMLNEWQSRLRTGDWRANA